MSPEDPTGSEGVLRSVPARPYKCYTLQVHASLPAPGLPHVGFGTVWQEKHRLGTYDV